MSVITTTSSKPISIFYNEVADLGKIERIVHTLSNYSLDVSLQKSDELYSDVFHQDTIVSSIAILACKKDHISLIKQIFDQKSDAIDVIILGLEPTAKLEFIEESCFYLDASVIPEDLICQWLVTKIAFYQSYAELSSTIYSRAMHWSANNHASDLLLEKNELFGAIDWLEQSIESQKEFRDLPLKIDYITASRQKHYTYADAYLHCGNFFQHIGNPILHNLRSRGREVIAGNFVSPKVYENKFNEQEIKRSHTFIFVYSSNSSQNNECKRALSYARSLNKRIITLITPNMKDYQLPPEIDLENVVYIPDDWMYHNDFVQVIEDKILKNHDYLTSHTKYVIESFSWIKHKKNYKLLLKEKEEVNEAADWLQEGERLNKAPLVSPLQKLYIERSITNFNLQKNIKLGLIILCILLFVLGSMFLAFLSSDEQNKTSEYSSDVENSKNSEGFAQNSSAESKEVLKLKGAKDIDYIEAFYSKERHVKSIIFSLKKVLSVDFYSDKSQFLLAYGVDKFGLVSNNGQKIKEFKSKNSQIFKAVFVPDKEKIISSGNELAIWDKNGKLEKKINPGNNSLCRDFIFLPNSQQIAFLFSNGNLLITDYSLDTLQTINITENRKPLSPYKTESITLKGNIALAVSEKNNELTLTDRETINRISLTEKQLISRETLPIYTEKYKELNGKKYLLGKNKQLYTKGALQWENAGIKLNLTDFIDCNKNGLFLLDEHKGIFYWNNEGEPELVFSKKGIVSYNSLLKTDSYLICLANDKFGNQVIFTTPRDIPNNFIDSYQLPLTTNNVVPTVNGYFLIDKKQISFLRKDTEEVVWKKLFRYNITSTGYNTKKQCLITGTENGILLEIAQNGDILKEKKVSDNQINAIVYSEENIYCGDVNGNFICLDNRNTIKFIEKKHQGSIHFLTVSPNHKYILSAGQDLQMIIWERNGKQYNKLKGPSSLVQYADFTSSASFLVSLGKAGDYILWDIEGNVIRYDYVPNQVKKVFFSNNGQFLMVCGKRLLSAVDAKGNKLFEINLPTNIVLEDITETENGFLELLCKDKDSGIFSIGHLPFKKNNIEKLLAVHYQL